jgi:hypothetical protein
MVWVCSDCGVVVGLISDGWYPIEFGGLILVPALQIKKRPKREDFLSLLAGWDLVHQESCWNSCE